MSDSGSTPDKRSPAAPTGPRGDHNADWDRDDAEWRHEPVAPKDEKNPLRSLGESIGEVVTGPGTAPADPRRRDDKPT